MSSTRVSEPGGLVKLLSLYVLPSQFDRGIGSALYRRFDACERRGGPALLEVWSANSRAIAFYVRRGWVETSTVTEEPDFELESRTLVTEGSTVTIPLFASWDAIHYAMVELRALADSFSHWMKRTVYLKQ